MSRDLTKEDLQQLSAWVNYSARHPSWDPAIVSRDFKAGLPLDQAKAEESAEYKAFWEPLKLLKRRPKESEDCKTPPSE
jgi:hypothetical protein